jgi:ureidoglycolate lyase
MKPIVLTKDNFTPFGDVIEVNNQSEYFSINDDFTQRYNDLAEINVNAEDGKTLVSIFRSTPLQQPIIIKKMERHPLSSQCFMPIGTQSYLVVVAPAGKFDENTIQVFVASANQGVNYHAGIWHHFSLALNHVSDFLVIDRGGRGSNCDVIDLKTPIEIELESELNSALDPKNKANHE